MLAQLLPELGPAREATASGSAARLTLFEAVCAVLDQASRTVPLVVILDDLHAAGRPSALLLRFAAAARLSRVLLLATYRTAEAAADPDVSDVIAALESVSPPLVLTGLSAADIGLMLPGADADVLAAVQRRSEGNPLFVSQVARLLGPGAAAVEEVPVPAASGRPSAARSPGSASAEGRRRHAGRGRDPGHGGGARSGHRPGPGRGGAGRPGRTGGPAVRPGHRDRPARPRPGRRRGVPVPARADQGNPLRRARTAGPRPGAPQDRRGARRQPGGSHAELAYHFLRAAPVSAEAAAEAVRHPRLAGQEALDALAYEEAAGHFRRALDVQRRAAQATPASRCGLLLSLAEALIKTGPDPAAVRAVDEAVRLARDADEPRLLAAAALLNAQHIDFNAPADTTAALLREAAAALGPADYALRARTLARLAMTLASAPADARDSAERAVRDAREAVTRDPDAHDPDGAAAATALATALTARHYVLWGSQDPADALAAADEIVTAAQRAREPETELDGRVLRLTHLLELGDGPPPSGSCLGAGQSRRLAVTGG